MSSHNSLQGQHWVENPLAYSSLRRRFSADTFRRRPSVSSPDLRSSSSFTNRSSRLSTDMDSTTYEMPELDQQPADVIARHPRIRAHLYLNSGVHIAGGKVRGRLDMSVLTDNVKISKILIDLIGVEAIENKSKGDESQHKVFMVKTFVIQDLSTPPCDAMVMGSKPDDEGYYDAAKGRTVFDFQLVANDGIPSSFMSRWASIRYYVACVIHVRLPVTLKKTTLKVTRETTILESIAPDQLITSPAHGTSSQHVFMGGKGPLQLECRIHKTVWPAGSPLYVETVVRNNTKKKISAIKILLIRRLTTFTREDDKLQPVVFAKKLILEIAAAKASWGGALSGEERSLLLELPLPLNVRSVSQAGFVDVTYAVQVAVSSMFTQDTIVDIPIRIVHPLSMTPVPYLEHKPFEEEGHKAMHYPFGRRASVSSVKATQSFLDAEHAIENHATTDQAETEDEEVQRGEAPKMRSSISICSTHPPPPPPPHPMPPLQETPKAIPSHPSSTSIKSRTDSPAVRRPSPSTRFTSTVNMPARRFTMPANSKKNTPVPRRVSAPAIGPSPAALAAVETALGGSSFRDVDPAAATPEESSHELPPTVPPSPAKIALSRRNTFVGSETVLEETEEEEEAATKIHSEQDVEVPHDQTDQKQQKPGVTEWPSTATLTGDESAEAATTSSDEISVAKRINSMFSKVFEESKRAEQDLSAVLTSIPV